MRIRSTLILGIGCLVATSQATILTFDIDNFGAGFLLPDAYGDNVASAANGDYHYDISNGITPNVAVSYSGKGTQVPLNFWTTGYSDLTNVVEYEPDGASGYSILLTADAGWNVQLHGFDLGNWGGEVTIPHITIFGENNVALMQYDNFVLGGSNTPHSDFEFGPALQGQSLKIDFDLTGLGGNSDNIGIDNISFTQVQSVVPEPATMCTLLFGAAALIRRKKANK